MNKTYKVYIHTCPDGMVYVGVTGMNIKKRWMPSHYKGISLYPYIEQYGWENITHQVIYTTPDRDEAYQVEEEMRQYYEEKGCCINMRRSGLIRVKDEKAYRQQYNPDYYQNHKEELKAYQRQYYQDHKEERTACNRQYRQYNPECRDKRTAYMRQWRQEHREEYNAYKRQYRAKKKAEKLKQAS